MGTKGFQGEQHMLRMILVGKTGSGKSSTANTILGKETFAALASFWPCTFKIETATCERGGMPIQIADTPGISDTTEILVHMQIADTFREWPYDSVIFYVVRFGRYSDEDFLDYQALKLVHGADIVRHIVVAFTFGDCFTGRHKPFFALLEKAPLSILQVLEECDYRYVIFDNVSQTSHPPLEKVLNEIAEKSSNRTDRHNDDETQFPSLEAYEGVMLEQEIEKRLEAVREHAKELQVQEEDRNIAELSLSLFKIDEEIHQLEKEHEQLQQQSKRQKKELQEVKQSLKYKRKEKRDNVQTVRRMEEEMKKKRQSAANNAKRRYKSSRVPLLFGKLH